LSLLLYCFQPSSTTSRLELFDPEVVADVHPRQVRARRHCSSERV
jgi:hypothetical protein